MGKRLIRFTNKNTGKTENIVYGELGRTVFAMTKSVNEMNAAVRWCNSHGAGDVFEKDNYTIEILSVS